MLLIHHDQAQVAEGQEQRDARADHQLRLPLPHHAPQPAPFGHGDAGMPFGGAGAEARLDPGEEIAGQRDLGQQDQRLAALAQGFGDGLEIDLGLARPGDALQQRGGIAAQRHRGDQGVARRHLVADQLRRGAGVQSADRADRAARPLPAPRPA